VGNGVPLPNQIQRSGERFILSSAGNREKYITDDKDFGNF